MIGWILFAVTALVAIIALAALKRKSDAELHRLEDARRTSLLQLQNESEKRVERLRREADSQQTRSRDQLAKDLFPALDSLHAALEGADDPDVERGIQLVLDDVYHAFAQHGIEAIGPEVGDPFEPARHEAIDVADEAEVGPGQVAHCHRRGFTCGARVLRPAMVSVGTKKTVEADLEEPATVGSSSS